MPVPFFSSSPSSLSSSSSLSSPRQSSNRLFGGEGRRDGGQTFSSSRRTRRYGVWCVTTIVSLAVYMMTTTPSTTIYLNHTSNNLIRNENYEPSSAAATTITSSSTTRSTTTTTTAITTEVNNNNMELPTTITTNNSSTTPTTTVVGNDPSPPCWSILWLVPNRWETNYIHDMLLPSHVPRCQQLQPSNVANNNNNNKNSKSRNKKKKDTFQYVSYDPTTTDLQSSQFERTIVVTSIWMGNAETNEYVLRTLYERRHRQRQQDDGNHQNNLASSSSRVVVFLLSEESHPYYSWSCSNPWSTFRTSSIVKYSDLILRNYWVHDCDNHNKPSSTSVLTKAPLTSLLFSSSSYNKQQITSKIVTVPLLVTKMAYGTGYEHHCSSFVTNTYHPRKEQQQLQQLQHSDTAMTDNNNTITTTTSSSSSIGNNTNNTGVVEWKFGKQSQDRKTLIYFSSGHVMRHRSTFVTAAQQVINDNNNNNIENNNNASTNNNPMTTTNRIVLKYQGKGFDIMENVDPKTEYAESLSDSRYAAVLKGNADETWRFTESLFCGAIPYLQKSVHDYYQGWIPSSLLDLLPYYTNQRDIRHDLRRFADQSQEEYDVHAQAVRKAAQDWIVNVRMDIGRRIQQLAMS